MKFDIENFSDVIEEAKPLLELHWDELALNKDQFKLDPNYEAYGLLEKANLVRIFTARSNGKLIGYACYFIHRNLHYKSMIQAVSDIFWLAPEARGSRTAVRFFTFIETALTLYGVHIMHTTHKTAHPAAGRVLEHLGHALIEAVYSKVLQR
jgi:hypothetical protein